jgi:cytochrome c biogenesis protein CcmG/thiol:disulfide interchange protein DsbE
MGVAGTIVLLAAVGWPARLAAEPPLAPSAAAPGSAAVQPGATAPLFSATRLDGGTLSLASLRGHVVLLDFWAVDCRPCRIEMPALESIRRRYARRGLVVIGVTEMDPTRDEALRFVAEAGVGYPILLDPGARIAVLYAVEAHPTTLVIDARGQVRFVNAGYLKGEEKEIEQAIKESLAAGKGTS